MAEEKTNQQPEMDLSEQRKVRREKLAALQAAGQDPFQQTHFDCTATSAQIKAHFEWNLHRADLSDDRNENKHYFIAKRMLERGGRRDIFLGTRECQGYVEPCEFGQGPGAYDGTPPIDFGLMLHGITYADEDGSGQMSERLWRPVMQDGVIQFIRPEDCPVIRPIHKQRTKSFVLGENMQGCDVLYQEVK